MMQYKLTALQKSPYRTFGVLIFHGGRIIQFYGTKYIREVVLWGDSK